MSTYSYELHLRDGTGERFFDAPCPWTDLLETIKKDMERSRNGNAIQPVRVERGACLVSAPYYERDGVAIYLGDCRDVLQVEIAVDRVEAALNAVRDTRGAFA